MVETVKLERHGNSRRPSQCRSDRIAQAVPRQSLLFIFLSLSPPCHQRQPGICFGFILDRPKRPGCRPMLFQVWCKRGPLSFNLGTGPNRFVPIHRRSP